VTGEAFENARAGDSPRAPVHVPPAALAAALALVVFAAGLRWGAMVAGGADSYGYVSQAGLWLRGMPVVQQDIARSSPWPLAAETWSPLGYRPSPRQRGALVPIYAPGLPLLMALFQTIGGYCAAYVVVPGCGALTVWVTFVLGRRVFDSAAAALLGALFVATSPVFLYQLMNAMSDVPVTAFAALALALAVARRPGLSGLAMSVAIAIRPNLAPLAVVVGAYLALSDWRALAWFAAGVAPSIAGVAWLNSTLYESPLVSGYGTSGDLYAVRFFAANLGQFAASIGLNEPAVVVGAIALAVARPSLAPRTGLLLAGWVVVVLLSYVFYQPFDAWWYLRFLLPAWPVVMMFAAAALIAALQRVPNRVAATALVLLPACLAIDVAARRSVFDLARGERRYVDVGRFVASHTEPDAVMLSVQHSGSLRLYAGRLTIRFIVLDPAWLDRAVDYLKSIGRHPYFVLDGGEVEAFRSRFGASNRLGRLDWQPLATLGDVASIYDPLARSDAPPIAIAQTRGARSWMSCDPPQSWPPVLRMK
jgi:hypothetical protein